MDSRSPGSPSRLFGGNFPFPLDGKTLLIDVADQFAAEFNTAAQEFLAQSGATGTLTPLVVRTAWPTTRLQCPCIAVQRQGSNVQYAGLGAHIEVRRVEKEDGDWAFQSMEGETISDRLEVSICTLNEMQRDELYLWFQQYLLDAAVHMANHFGLAGLYQLRVTDGSDDLVEYQGSQDQPGFQFYTGRISVTAQYDRLLITDVDRIKAIATWQLYFPDLYWAGVAGDTEDPVIFPPDDTPDPPVVDPNYSTPVNPYGS